jgi:exopolysaccharide biosynthesis polyprenyl glycosylphosphotransferase
MVERMQAKEPPFAPLIIHDKASKRLHCQVMLVLSDIIMIGFSFVVANYYVSRIAAIPIEHGFVMLGAIMPLFMIQAGSNRSYTAEILDNANLGARRAVRALTIAAALILLIAYLFKASANFSRGVFLIGFFASFFLVIIARKVLQAPITRMLVGSADNIMVICDDVPYVQNDKEIVLAAKDLGFDPSTSDPRVYHNFARTIAYADRIIVACTPQRAVVWAPVLRTLSIDGEILTDVRDEISAIGMRSFGDRRTLVINYGPMSLSARAVKRAFDITVSLALIVPLLPLLIGVAVAIRLESPGPVFFKQERVGRGNRIFRIFKFRSMYAHATDAQAATLTQVGDARVTRVGLFIRRTSIDELPQLFNVLKGDMSIVGPRPHALAAKAADLLYWDADTRYRERHTIKPGMTGLAQVRGFRGNTHQVEDLTNRVQADLEYVATWSLMNDFYIVLKTLKVMQHANAY